MEISPDCFDLPPRERAVRYRAYAEQMQVGAAAALTEQTRAGYLKMAQEWLHLADEIDAKHVDATFTIDPHLAWAIRMASS
jgi:hypothetical protein